MNSCIYTGKIVHVRKVPKENSFSYGFYMIYFDLDELEIINKRIRGVGINTGNLLSFYDRDHFNFVFQKGHAQKIASKNLRFTPSLYAKKSTKERILTLLKEVNADFSPGKVFLLTNARNMGYVFNPVSFYFCYDTKGKLRAMFSEVNNTFADQKMYYVPVDPKEEWHTSSQKKDYYISPFVEHNTMLSWGFKEPGDQLHMVIDSKKNDASQVKAVLMLKRSKLTSGNILKTMLRYPLVTVMTIVRIHYQALRLWMKGVPFFSKKKTDKKILGV